MRTILAILLIVSFCLVAEAKVYVCLDKSTGDPKGAVNIKESAVPDWNENFIMIEADETYRGKQGHEVKYKNQKLRHATQKEIDDYLAEQEVNKEDLKIQRLLDLLDNNDVKQKIKDIAKP